MSLWFKLWAACATNKSEQLLASFELMVHWQNEDDITLRIKTQWLKWRSASKILCDCKKSLKLKGKFYRMRMKLAILYGSMLGG